MSSEYIVRFVVRDPAHPLGERVLFEFGASDPRQLTEAAANAVGLLRTLGTPEKVADMIGREQVVRATIGR